MNSPTERAAKQDKNVMVVRHFLSLNGCNDMIPLTTQCHIASCKTRYRSIPYGGGKTESKSFRPIARNKWVTTYLLPDTEHDEHEIKQDGPKRWYVFRADHGERRREQFGGQSHGLISALLRRARHVVLHRPFAQQQAAVLHPPHRRQVFARLGRVLFEQEYIGTRALCRGEKAIGSLLILFLVTTKPNTHRTNWAGTRIPAFRAAARRCWPGTRPIWARLWSWWLPAKRLCGANVSADCATWSA